jgi:hypothetical protein
MGSEFVVFAGFAGFVGSATYGAYRLGRWAFGKDGGGEDTNYTAGEALDDVNAKAMISRHSAWQAAAKAPSKTKKKGVANGKTKAKKAQKRKSK